MSLEVFLVQLLGSAFPSRPLLKASRASSFLQSRGVAIEFLLSLPLLELKSTHENTLLKEKSEIGKQHHWIGSSSFK